MTEVVLHKIASLERCISQVKTYYAEKRDLQFEVDFLLQDAIAMNLQRACELVIDLANYTVKKEKIGLPKHSREGFEILAQQNIITLELAGKMNKMVGFRNTLVHQYQQVDLKLMVEIIEVHVEDLLRFSQQIKNHFS